MEGRSDQRGAQSKYRGTEVGVGISNTEAEATMAVSDRFDQDQRKIGREERGGDDVVFVNVRSGQVSRDATHRLF